MPLRDQRPTSGRHAVDMHEKQTRDHLSVMGGMTPTGKVYTLARQESLNGLHSSEVLQHLLRVAGPRLLVIWDGSPIHRRAEVKAVLVGTRGKVWVGGLAQLRSGSEPWDQGGWHHLKVEERTSGRTARSRRGESPVAGCERTG
ncbi:MAG: transposase [Planctomycetia bacterium]|nr:transposase [Planctomycetia bacterium]